MKTKLVERIRIRDSSGKIKGPFSRSEVLTLIQKKKIEGEEEIFLESEGRWKPIGADTEFFDLIQLVYFGVKPGQNSVYKNPESKGVWTGSFDKNPYPKVDATERLPSGTQAVAQPTTTQLQSDRVAEEIKKEATFNRQVKQSPSTPLMAPTAKLPEQPNLVKGFEDFAPQKESRAKRPLGGFLIVIVMIGAGLYVANMIFQQQKTAQDFSKISYDYNFQKGYFRPLALRLRLLPGLAHPGTKLSPDFEQVRYLPLNVHDLLLMVDENERKPNSSRNASVWVLKAWTLRVVADALFAADPVKGRQLKDAAVMIRREIAEAVPMPEEFTAMFSALDLFLDGKPEASLKTIAELGRKPLVAKIFEREVSSWASFMPEFEQTIKPVISINDEDLADLPLQVQLEEGLRQSATKEVFSPNFLKRAETLLAYDSHPLFAWYALGQYNAINFKGNPQIANRYYFTGVSELSLFPRVLQAFYWRNYAQFIKASGAGDPAKLLEIAELILKGKFDGDATALDVDNQVFHFGALLDSYKKAFEQNEMNNIELASFEVLSEASPNAKENLISVVMAPLLDRVWSLADRQLRLIEKTFPFDLEVKTLRVWFEGERFRFDKAEQVLTTAFSNVAGKNAQEQLKAEGILHILGRDYDTGVQMLKKYLEINQQDGLSHYFIGRASFEAEKYTECVRATQLAQLNSLGPLKLRAQIMNYRCRVRAALGTDAALREFALFIERFPQTAVAREEYVRALLDADQSQEAAKIAEQDVKDNPLSAGLKLLLGEVYERRGQNNEALLMYNEARKLEPNRSRSASHIGDLFMKEKRFAEAAENYVDAATQDSEMPELSLKAARAYREAKMYKQAAEKYFDEIDRRPAVLETFLEAAEFLLEANMPSEVPVLSKHFSEDFKSDSRVVTRLAQAYFAMGDEKNALSNADLAVRLNPKEAEPYRILATIYYKQGQYSQAKLNYEKYLVIFPQAKDAGEIRQMLSLPPFSSQ